MATLKRNLNYAKILTTEIAAILLGAEFLRTRVDGSRVLFLTDSQAALNFLTRNSCSSSIQRQAIIALGGIEGEVILRWVKAHSGRGNREADSAAKEAAREEGGRAIFPLPKIELKMCLEARAHGKWMDRWNSLATCRQSKIFWRTADKTVSRHILNFSREKAGFAIRLWTGHGFFRRHNNICGSEATATCRLCSTGREETPEHLVLDCPFLAKIDLGSLATTA